MASPVSEACLSSAISFLCSCRTDLMEYYEYYLEAYSAVLSGMVREFSLEEDGKWKRYYGLKAFSPVAKGFDYSHYDDFGSCTRRHSLLSSTFATSLRLR